jgi:transcriptional regulator with XRE-family HTH domain
MGTMSVPEIDPSRVRQRARPPSLAVALGRRVRALRDARGLSLREAARRARVGAKALAEIENGVRLPRLPSLARVARAFGLTLGELVRGVAP